MLLSVVKSVPLPPAPDPFLVFCFFNLIMALLFVSSSGMGAKPSAPALDERGDIGGQVGSPEGVRTTEDVTDERDERGVDAGGCCSIVPEVAALEGNRDICRAGDEEASDGGDCEELNRRAEEFIVRMNRAWVAERAALRSSMAIGEKLTVGVGTGGGEGIP